MSGFSRSRKLVSLLSPRNMRFNVDRGDLQDVSIRARLLNRRRVVQGAGDGGNCQDHQSGKGEAECRPVRARRAGEAASVQAHPATHPASPAARNCLKKKLMLSVNQKSGAANAEMPSAQKTKAPRDPHQHMKDASEGRIRHRILGFEEDIMRSDPWRACG